MLGLDALQQLARDGYLLMDFPHSLRHEALSLAERFYDLPLQERLALVATRETNFLGYIPSEHEVESFRLEMPTFSGTRRRGYCAYDFITEPHAFSPSGLRCANMWPGDPVFAREIRDFNRKICEFTNGTAQQALELIDTFFGSELPRQAFDGATCSMTRFLLYEVTGTVEISKAHTDYEFLAVVISEEDGLEIEHPGNRWVTVPLEKAKCVILPGDMMAVASHGNIAAVRHRVVFGKRRRLSVICFQGLKYDTPIPYPGRAYKVPFGEHICSMKVRSTPHLEQALEEGRLKLRFDVPKRNPLTPS